MVFLSQTQTLIKPLTNQTCCSLSPGPSVQPDVVPSIPAIDTTVMIAAGTMVTIVSVPLTIQDDDISLENVERVGFELELPMGVSGVVVGTPDTTFVNVIDDDGECVCGSEGVEWVCGCGCENVVVRVWSGRVAVAVWW